MGPDLHLDHCLQIEHFLNTFSAPQSSRIKEEPRIGISRKPSGFGARLSRHPGGTLAGPRTSGGMMWSAHRAPAVAVATKQISTLIAQGRPLHPNPDYLQPSAQHSMTPHHRERVVKYVNEVRTRTRAARSVLARHAPPARALAPRSAPPPPPLPPPPPPSRAKGSCSPLSSCSLGWRARCVCAAGGRLWAACADGGAGVQLL